MSREVQRVPHGVAERLAALRALYVPERLAEATACEMKRPRRAPEAFADAVARRLHELRALCELARYLHRAENRQSVGPVKVRARTPYKPAYQTMNPSPSGSLADHGYRVERATMLLRPSARPSHRAKRERLREEHCTESGRARTVNARPLAAIGMVIDGRAAALASHQARHTCCGR